MSPTSRTKCVSLVSVVALSLGWQAAQAQGMLPGCRLENGSLQCVPGLTASPQEQIHVLEGRISEDQKSEEQVEQNIEGLSRFVLEGDALEGQLLKADLMLDGDAIESVHIHWYRRKGNGHWQLVANTSETTYQLGRDDLGRSLMAVLTVSTSDGNVNRTNSNVIGPITAR